MAEVRTCYWKGASKKVRYSLIRVHTTAFHSSSDQVSRWLTLPTTQTSRFKSTYDYWCFHSVLNKPPTNRTSIQTNWDPLSKLEETGVHPYLHGFSLCQNLGLHFLLLLVRIRSILRVGEQIGDLVRAHQWCRCDAPVHGSRLLVRDTVNLLPQQLRLLEAGAKFGAFMSIAVSIVVIQNFP